MGTYHMDLAGWYLTRWYCFMPTIDWFSIYTWRESRDYLIHWREYFSGWDCRLIWGILKQWFSTWYKYLILNHPQQTSGVLSGRGTHTGSGIIIVSLYVSVRALRKIPPWTFIWNFIKVIKYQLRLHIQWFYNWINNVSTSLIHKSQLDSQYLAL